MASQGQTFILIVGEKASAREHLRQAFSFCGFPVLEATDLKRADGIIAGHDVSPSLIIGCSGSPTESESIKTWHRKHPKIPLLVLPEQNDSGRTPSAGQATAQTDLTLQAHHPPET